MLRRGHAKPEVVQWVRKHFRCDDCEAHKMPKARRPAAVPKTYRLNHVVGLDLVQVKNLEGVHTHWLNTICWGTSFQQAYPVVGDGRKTPENVFETFIDSWVRMFGMPEMVIVDPGTEFRTCFADMCSSYGCLILPTDPRCPWQNGRTERAGKEWKYQFK